MEKTLIKDWIEKVPMSRRLYNILRCYCGECEVSDSYVKKEFQNAYVEDINFGIMTARNMGKKTLSELYFLLKENNVKCVFYSGIDNRKPSFIIKEKQ